MLPTMLATPNEPIHKDTMADGIESYWEVDKDGCITLTSPWNMTNAVSLPYPGLNPD